MISYSEAKQLLLTAAAKRPLSSERVALEKALGRVCADSVMSPEASPPFTNSSMDGFALRSSESSNASPSSPNVFAVLGTIAAGDPAPASRHASAGESTAWEIMTGAPVPAGFDAVVKIEDVTVERSASGQAHTVTIKAPLTKDENIRARGADFPVGQAVVHKGDQLRADHLMGLAALGVTTVVVYRQPRVCVISTGHEIRPFTTPNLEPGQIRNSTAPYFTQAFGLFGIELLSMATVEDRTEDFLAALDLAIAQEPDLIVTTGAVSAGRFDFIKEALLTRDAKVHFHKAAIRPGKPILFAELPAAGSPALFGLPGNPISTVVGLRFFIAPYVRALQGLAPEKPVRAKLTHALEKPEDLRCFFKASVKINEDSAQVTALQGQPSFMIHSLNLSNSWAIFPEGKKIMPAGTSVEVMSLYPNFWELQS